MSEESDGVNMAEMQENYKKSFPQMPVCGRYIANKAMEPGPNQLIIDSAEKITRYAPLPDGPIQGCCCKNFILVIMYFRKENFTCPKGQIMHKQLSSYCADTNCKLFSSPITL